MILFYNYHICVLIAGHLFSLILQTSSFECSNSFNNNYTLSEEQLWGQFSGNRHPSKHLPLPNVHYPVYLFQLAKYEAFIDVALVDLAEQAQYFQSDDELDARISDYRTDLYEDIELAQFHYVHQFLPDDHARVVSGNPILTFKMIWRLAVQLPLIYNIIHEEPSALSELRNGPGKHFLMDGDKAIGKLPTDIQVIEVFQRILRLQMIYDLNPLEIANGRLFGVNTGPYITVPQMFSLATYASESGMYTLAIPWLEVALDQLNSNQMRQREVPLDFSQNDIMEYLMATAMEHDSKRPSHVQWKDFNFFKEKLLHKNQTFVKERLPMRQFNWPHLRRLNKAFNRANYYGLCSGENHQTEEEKAELFCWYDQTSDPTLYIAPVKKEMLSKYPYIVQMYEVVGESTIQEMLVQAHFKRPKKPDVVIFKNNIVMYDLLDPAKRGANVRTGVETRLDDPFPNLSILLEASTGLSVAAENSSEPHFVVSYAFGGHAECHVDRFLPELPPTPQGNRMATVLIYLEEPELGGETAFPLAGITAKPIRGSAIFWYNLKTNEETDEDSFHCACPVIMGWKTVSNKWIGYKNQFNKRLCDLQDEY